MRVMQWTTVDKASWARGEWDGEPDKMQWQDEATGLPCLIVRNQSGALCGYVGVTQEHPAFGVQYDSVSIPGKEYGPDVHCGLTFSDFCADATDHSKGICHLPAPGEPDRVWWLGFDCAHCDDYSPGSEARYREITSASEWRQHERVLGLGRPTGSGSYIGYRNVEYVKRECASLASQLMHAASVNGFDNATPK